MFFLHYFTHVFLYPWNRSQIVTDHAVLSKIIMARNLDVPFGLK